MAKTVKIVLHGGVIRSELLKGAGVAGMCEGIANSMASNAGTGYAVERDYTSQRARFRVYPKTKAAKRDAAENNTLVKASRRKVNTE